MTSIYMKKGVLLFIILRHLVSGIEEYIILPTAWSYLNSLGESQLYLGLVLASHAAGRVIFRPVHGKITDRYRCDKLILLISHALGVLGNAMYALSSSPYFALVGRFLCGIAAASDVLLLRQVEKATKAKHRAKVFGLFDGVYTLGCGLGPTFATVLTFDFKINDWHITAKNSPGFVMAVAWLFVLILTAILPKKFSDDENVNDKPLVLTAESFSDEFEDPQKTAVKRSQVLCLLSYIFFIWFFASVTGYYTPILAIQMFNLGQFYVNLLFGNALLFQMVLYLLCYIADEKKVDERVLLLIAMFLQAIPLSILGIYGIKWSTEHSLLLLVYVVIGTPLVSFTLACSLLSKITRPELTGYYRHLGYTCLHLATFLGRLVPAFFFAKTLLAWLALQLGFLWLMMTSSYVIIFFMKY